MRAFLSAFTRGDSLDGVLCARVVVVVVITCSADKRSSLRSGLKIDLQLREKMIDDKRPSISKF